MFLDCCHSGFEPGTYERNIVGFFNSEELAYQMKDEQYSVGFASCQGGQKSISSPVLQHGVWSYFLLQALKGDASDLVYKNGLLISDKLQDFLRIETSRYVKQNTEKRGDQTPMQFGTFTTRFLVDDINPIFDFRMRQRSENASNFKSIIIYRLEDEYVVRLPGFNYSKYHYTPDKLSRQHDRFIRSISGDVVNKDIAEVSCKIRLR